MTVMTTKINCSDSTSNTLHNIKISGNGKNNLNMKLSNITRKLRKTLETCNKEKESYKFLIACKKLKLIPKGFQTRFQLTYGTNDNDFIKQIQNQCDAHASTILDIFIQTKSKMINLYEKDIQDSYENCKDEKEKMVIKQFQEEYKSPNDILTNKFKRKISNIDRHKKMYLHYM